MDTIAAISTTVGQSAIGIIKVSGPSAFKIGQKIFCGKKNKELVYMPSHSIQYGYIVDPETKKKIDEVLLSIMKAPNTYTREDIIEINCHGGKVPLYKTLELVLEAGARLAEPGEFTKRAFLNGRIDLTQAEAIIDIINLQSEKGLHLILNNLEGYSFKSLYYLQAEILKWEVLIEAELNFPEDIPGGVILNELLQLIANWQKVIQNYLNNFERSKILIEGLKIVITGKTNVGKSSLMNLLLKKDRSIVTHLAGTTTDIIEDNFFHDGNIFRLIDTAGFCKFKNEIEKEGIRRSQECLSKADIIILVLDGSQPIDDNDALVIDIVKKQECPTLILFNKSDLGIKLEEASILKIMEKPVPIIHISTITKEGIENISIMLSNFLVEQTESDLQVGVNLRQNNILSKIFECLSNIKNHIINKQSYDKIAEEFRVISRLFKQFKGDEVSVEIIDQIFDRFCIGK